MEKQQNNRPLLSDELERPAEQLDFNNAEQEVRDLLEQKTLPSSSKLEKYNQLMPGGAERVFNIIEDERIHQRKIELKQLRGRTILNYLVSIFGFIFSIILVMVIMDITIAGGSWVGLGLAWFTIIIVFLFTFAPHIKTKIGRK